MAGHPVGPHLDSGHELVQVLIEQLVGVFWGGEVSLHQVSTPHHKHGEHVQSELNGVVLVQRPTTALQRRV